MTSTLTWDTVRALTTTVGILLLGPAILAALRRARLGKGPPQHGGVDVARMARMPRERRRAVRR